MCELEANLSEVDVTVVRRDRKDNPQRVRVRVDAVHVWGLKPRLAVAVWLLRFACYLAGYKYDAKLLKGEL